ncbi:polysaccharide deacetylase family protein [Ferruginibacter sp.]
MPEKIKKLHTKIFGLRSRIKGLPTDAGWWLGFNNSFFNNAKGSRILLYHGVCKGDPLQFNTLFVTVKTFEAQLKLYKKYFNLVSMDAYYAGDLSREKFNLCLTFDDGFANNYSYVLPLLEKYQVPATFFITGIRSAGYNILWNDLLSIAYQYGPSSFVLRNDTFIKDRNGKYISSSTNEPLAALLRTTGFADKAAMMQALGNIHEKVPEDYWLQLTAEQIKQLSQSLWVTIGNHSSYHNDLARIPVAEAGEDMAASKKYLEGITGKSINAFAFPYGSYNSAVAEAAINCGHTQLLATDFNKGDQSNGTFLKERLTINPFISNINQLHASITGNYR